MNVLTGAWCKFTGWNANCFELYKDNLYFGGNDGTVNLAYTGTVDGTLPIPADMQCAFNYFDDPGRLKRITMVQPLMNTNGDFTPHLSIDVDFNLATAVAPLFIFNTGSIWDVDKWDLALWSTGLANSNQWLSANAIGRALAIHISTNIQTTGDAVLQVNAFNAIMEMGGFL